MKNLMSMQNLKIIQYIFWVRSTKGLCAPRSTLVFIYIYIYICNGST
jgi:hypothetical protein